MKLAATAYNLKKWLKLTEKRAKSGAGILPSFIEAMQEAIGSVLSHFKLAPRPALIQMGL